ncbi:hypothetical protein [Robiginitomaculum antarcticum]|uniref:hypothetical protein n=1 Tax=Robiginitomaculum antarcticum TaxID=437507 RepID=UPI000377BB2E|nr:hypothetical protein [Robiginitomaculum antarcticum]
MTATAIIVDDPALVEQRLEQLNLELKPLLDVLAHIVSHKRGLTLDHPTWMIGISAAGEGVYMLRTLLRTRGWMREEESSFELTVYSDDNQDLALNIAKGTSAVGNSELNVETAYSRGPQTVNAVDCNAQLMFDLPPPPINEIETAMNSDGRHTWYLLYYVEGNKIKGELSLPLGLSADKHIADWHERIILPDVNIDDHTPTSAAVIPNESVVSITRKKRSV